MNISGGWKAFNKKFGLFQNKKKTILASSFVPLFDESATAGKMLSNKIIEGDDSTKVLVGTFMQEASNNNPKRIDSLKPIYTWDNATSQANKGFYTLRKDNQYLDVFEKMYYRAYVKKATNVYRDIEDTEEVEEHQLRVKFILSMLESNNSNEQSVKIKSSLKEYNYNVYQYKCKCDDDTFYSPILDGDYIKTRNGDYYASIEIAFDIDGNEEYILFKDGDCFFDIGTIPTKFSNYHVEFDGLVHEYSISTAAHRDLASNYFIQPTSLFLPVKVESTDFIIKPGTQYSAYLKSLGIDINNMAGILEDDKIKYAFITYAAKKDDPLIEKTLGATYDNLIGYTELFNLVGKPENFESYFAARFYVDDGDVKCKVHNLFLPGSGPAEVIVDRVPIPVPTYNSGFYKISSSVYGNENTVPNNTFSLTDFRLKNLCLYVVTEEEVDISFMATADGRAFQFALSSVGTIAALASGNPYLAAMALTGMMANQYRTEMHSNDYSNLQIGLTIASLGAGGYSIYKQGFNMSSAIHAGNMAVDVYSIYTEQMFNDKFKKQLTEKKEIEKEDRDLQRELDELLNPFMLSPFKKIDTYFDTVFELPSITTSIPDIMLQLPKAEINDEQVKKLY